MKRKQPAGITPYRIWMEEHDHEPDMAALLARYTVVLAALERYRSVGREPPPWWLYELGVKARTPACRAH